MSLRMPFRFAQPLIQRVILATVCDCVFHTGSWLTTPLLGWKRCVTMGLKEKTGLRNADSYAYFALGKTALVLLHECLLTTIAARMISPNDGRDPARPNKDGSTSLLVLGDQSGHQSQHIKARYFDPSVNGSILQPNASSFNASNSPTRSTFSQLIDFGLKTTESAESSSQAMQTDILTARLLPPEARTRSAVDSTMKQTMKELPVTSSSKAKKPTGIIMMTSGPYTVGAEAASTNSSTLPSMSKTLDPGLSNQNATRETAPASIKRASSSKSQLHPTLLGSSNHTDPVSQAAPNVTSPVLSSNQTSATKLPSPITSSPSNLTTTPPTPMTVRQLPLIPLESTQTNKSRSSLSLTPTHPPASRT